MSKEILRDSAKLSILSKSSFDAIDIDHSGWIEKDELLNCLLQTAKETKCPFPSEEEFEQIFSLIDRDKDGRVNSEEFEILVYQVLKTLS